jgi:hypothetical protein
MMNDVQQSYSVEFTNMFDISSSPEIDTLFVVIEITFKLAYSKTIYTNNYLLNDESLPIFIVIFKP